MDNHLIISVIVGMGAGLAVIVVFGSMSVTNGNAFTPESYYGWAPESGRWPPRIVLTEDVDSGLDQVVTIEFSSELKLGPLGD